MGEYVCEGSQSGGRSTQTTLVFQPLCDNMILHLDWHELPLATNMRNHHLCNPDSLGVSAANNHLLSMKGKCTIATSQKRKTGTRKWQQAVWWFMQWGHPHSRHRHLTHQSPNTNTYGGERMTHELRDPKQPQQWRSRSSHSAPACRITKCTGRSLPEPTAHQPRSNRK